MDCTDLKNLFSDFAKIMNKNKEWLLDLDERIGDNDIGYTAVNGFRAASKALNNSKETNLGKLLYLAGKKMSVTVPSTMGTLLAFGFMNAGQKMNPGETWNAIQFGEMLTYFYEGIQQLGHATLNEKTILDALHPLCTAFRTEAESGSDFKKASEKGYRAAKQGFDDTKNMVARHGKAAIYGQKSLAAEDPGAAIALLMARATKDYFNGINT